MAAVQGEKPDTGSDASPVGRIEFRNLWDARNERLATPRQDRGHGVAVAIAITNRKRSGIRAKFRRGQKPRGELLCGSECVKVAKTKGQRIGIS